MNPRTFLKQFEQSADRDRLVDVVYDEMAAFCKENDITENDLLPNMATDYHKELGFPDVEYPTGTFAVEPSGHARIEADSDRYGGFRLPTKVNLTESMYERHPKQATGSEKGEKTLPHIFELTVEQGEVVKLGARTHYDDERDIVLILKPAAGVIVTAWINVKGDAHHTLNEEKYERVK